jgi:hypothetical protein
MTSSSGEFDIINNDNVDNDEESGIYLNSIPASWNENRLLREFCKFGSLKKVKILPCFCLKNKCKSAFIYVLDKNDAKNIISLGDSVVFLFFFIFFFLFFLGIIMILEV